MLIIHRDGETNCKQPRLTYIVSVKGKPQPRVHDKLVPEGDRSVLIRTCLRTPPLIFGLRSLSSVWSVRLSSLFKAHFLHTVEACAQEYFPKCSITSAALHWPALKPAGQLWNQLAHFKTGQSFKSFPNIYMNTALFMTLSLSHECSYSNSYS